MTETEVRHVAYKGTAPAMTDLMAGTSVLGMDAPSVVEPLIQAARLQAIAVALPRRMKVMPDVPTLDAAGLKGLRAYAWNGNALWAPAGTPAAVLDRLDAAVNAAMADRANARQIEDAGVVPFAPMNRAQVEAFMEKEYETRVPLVWPMKVTLDCEAESHSPMPALHAQTPCLIVANPRHGPRHGRIAPPRVV